MTDTDFQVLDQENGTFLARSDDDDISICHGRQSSGRSGGVGQRRIGPPLVDRRRALVHQGEVDAVEHGLARSRFAQMPAATATRTTPARRAVRSADMTSVRHHHGSDRKPSPMPSTRARTVVLRARSVMPLRPATSRKPLRGSASTVPCETVQPGRRRAGCEDPGARAPGRRPSAAGWPHARAASRIRRAASWSRPRRSRAGRWRRRGCVAPPTMRPSTGPRRVGSRPSAAARPGTRTAPPAHPVRSQNAATSGSVCSLMPEIETISCPAIPALSQRKVSQRFPTLCQQLTIRAIAAGPPRWPRSPRGVGFGARAEPVDHLATGCEQELLEVPLHVACLAPASAVFVSSTNSGWRSGAVDVGLLQKRKGDTVGARSRTSGSPRPYRAPGP